MHERKIKIMVELYEDMHGEIVVTLLRIMLGILLLISQKIIPERFKEFIVTSYYGVLVCMITTYVSNLKISSMIIGIVLGLVVSVMLTIYNKTEDFTNLIVIFIAMYEIMEVIVYAFDFDFSSFATNIMDVYADNRNMYFKAVVALYITVISYIVISTKEKARNYLQKNKHFWLGIFFIVGAVFANTLHPLEIPYTTKDLWFILWNINYSHDEFWLPILILFIVLIIKIIINILRKNTNVINKSEKPI